MWLDDHSRLGCRVNSRLADPVPQKAVVPRNYYFKQQSTHAEWKAEGVKKGRNPEIMIIHLWDIGLVVGWQALALKGL